MTSSPIVFWAGKSSLRYDEEQPARGVPLIGRRLRFGTLADLIDSLEEAHAAGRLKQRLKTLTHPALLVVDEIGYLSVTPNGASLFFQLVNSRYGRASTVLTSNKGFCAFQRFRSPW